MTSTEGVFPAKCAFGVVDYMAEANYEAGQLGINIYKNTQTPFRITRANQVHNKSHQLVGQHEIKFIKREWETMVKMGNQL